MGPVERMVRPLRAAIEKELNYAVTVTVAIAYFDLSVELATCIW